jgi:hypothetical protein
MDGAQVTHGTSHHIVNFTPETRCIVYGLQNRAVQGMLDFDFMCKVRPSVYYHQLQRTAAVLHTLCSLFPSIRA